MKSDREKSPTVYQNKNLGAHAAGKKKRATTPQRAEWRGFVAADQIKPSFIFRFWTR